jgi:hypothetical protein
MMKLSTNHALLDDWCQTTEAPVLGEHHASRRRISSYLVRSLAPTVLAAAPEELRLSLRANQEARRRLQELDAWLESGPPEGPGSEGPGSEGPGGEYAEITGLR